MIGTGLLTAVVRYVDRRFDLGLDQLAPQNIPAAIEAWQAREAAWEAWLDSLDTPAMPLAA